MVEQETGALLTREANDDEDRLARAISAYVRAEFKAPVDVVTSFIDLILEDAAREDLKAYRADLHTMKAASIKLEATVTRLLDAATSRQSLADRQLNTFTSELRHALRTPITAIMGYGELLLEEAREEGFASLLETLDSLLAAARRLLGNIDSMVEFIHSGSIVSRVDTAGSPGEQSDIVEQAISTLRSVFAEVPHVEARVTGFILIVDDNPSSLDLLTHRLERDGHRVGSCSDGETALRATATENFDLILLDLLMPGINGIEVLRRLRENPRTADTPVVMMSGVDATDSIVRSIEAGADDFLVKPLDPVLLRVRLSAILERKFLRDREAARVEQLRLEREKSERLLRSMLPLPIVERLRQGETVIADLYPTATILFCDIVGFTSIADRLPPGETIALLNTVFSRLDKLVAVHRLEKIKTIGDAYMVAGGLPRPRKDHVKAVVAMARQVAGAVAEAGTVCGEPLQIRIGIHTGPVIAGIISTDKVAYDVWGDTVNVASRMERTGVPGRIHITADIRAALGADQVCEALPPIDIKGKGPMETFLLT